MRAAAALGGCLLTLLVACALVFAAPSVSAQEIPDEEELEGYVPAWFCGFCHEEIYEEWKGSAKASTPSYAQVNPRCQHCMAPQYEFGLTDIQCVGCHGKGHASRPIEEVRTSEFCGECHSGGHHPQFEMWNVSGHKEFEVGCIACHGPHALEFVENLTAVELCESCHETTKTVFAGSPHSEREVECTSCHMYGLTFYHDEWHETVSHAMTVGARFNEETGLVETGLNETCWQSDCHAEQTLSLTTVEAVQDEVTDIISLADAVIVDANGTISSASETVSTAREKGVDVSSAESKLSGAANSFQQATSFLNDVINDKSEGFHNREKAAKLLSDAVSLALNAKVLATEAQELAEVGIAATEAEAVKESLSAELSAAQSQITLLYGGVALALLIGVGVGWFIKRR